MDPDQDRREKMDRKEGLSGPLPIAAGIVMAGLAGAAAYFTLQAGSSVAADATVDIAMLVLIASVTLIAIFHERLH